MSFSHDDVQRIIQLLDASHFDELHLEADGIKLDLRRYSGASTTASAPVSTQVATTTASTGRSASAQQPADPPKSQKADTGNAENSPSSATQTELLEIKAPMLGTFYR